MSSFPQQKKQKGILKCIQVQNLEELLNDPVTHSHHDYDADDSGQTSRPYYCFVVGGRGILVSTKDNVIFFENHDLPGSYRYFPSTPVRYTYKDQKIQRYTGRRYSKGWYGSTQTTPSETSNILQNQVVSPQGRGFQSKRHTFFIPKIRFRQIVDCLKRIEFSKQKQQQQKGVLYNLDTKSLLITLIRSIVAHEKRDASQKSSLEDMKNKLFPNMDRFLLEAFLNYLLETQSIVELKRRTQDVVRKQPLAHKSMSSRQGQSRQGQSGGGGSRGGGIAQGLKPLFQQVQRGGAKSPSVETDPASLLFSFPFARPKDQKYLEMTVFSGKEK